MLTVGSLFAGIGGFDLGLERTGGFEVRWQVEIDDYCRRVLERHWPHVKRYGDIRTVTDVERVDVLCGGFPCQDISDAGRRVGINGERSGLWSEYSRIISLARPRYVIVENVAALLGRGMGRVLGDLSESGYDAEWDVVPACAVGAPHRRERAWIVAYPRSEQHQSGRTEIGRASTEILLADSESCGVESERVSVEGGERLADADRCRSDVADPNSSNEHRRGGNVQMGRIWGKGQTPNYDDIGGDQWRIEPDVGRVAHGIPARVDRLKGLGNAIVPQIATWIGERILEHERLATGARGGDGL